ncbi:pantetheine-phosphate adenylyltransferase [Amphibiibacter pelophylacis]|uniref:Pantetheine-phosphate adenylyltransferase n=1 Tax=Amphibiibacter pelophylacis TaxID=1799477 RepID=A0ACC6P1K5_9BURK
MDANAPNTLAVYPGTFDPITQGHVDLVQRASRLFGRLTVLVAQGHHKNTLFSADERVDLAREALAGLPGVQVQGFTGLLRDTVLALGGQVVVRGLRGVSDFDYEFQMAGMNRHLMPEVDTVFLAPSPQVQYISGTFVREIARLGGDVAPFVPPSVLAPLQRRLAGD